MRTFTIGRKTGEQGFALVIVLLVLLALLVLTTPFLASATHADRASTQRSERAEARIGLDAIAAHTRQFLSDTYPSADMDKTPFFDGLDEIAVDNHFDPTFLNANDPNGPMWDVELSDVAGMIDLNSASPFVFANMMELSTRFSGVVTPESKELPLASSTGLEETGFLWCEGELINYSKIVENNVTEFIRGMFGPAEKTEWRGGPRPKSAHGAGAPVVDQRAFAPALWRLRSHDGELNTYEALEELSQSGLYAHALQLASKEVVLEMPPHLVQPMLSNGTVHAGARGGPAWQRAARVTSAVVGKQDGKLRVDNGRWLGVGSTVRIRDGQTTELALVQNVLGNGEIALDRILANDYEAYAAVLDVLVRRPVNINTAKRDVLRVLFLNLQLSGKNSRITADEAGELADLVIESRPFTGLEDFLRRVVLPSAGIERLPSDAPVVPAILQQSGGFLDPLDAVALYLNGLNANDVGLSYSTMPYAFTTRDTYACELRSAIHAESGVERFTLIRDEVLLVAPQKELVKLWARQDDFDEELRTTCDAPWWATGPNATTRYDSGSTPPSRAWAHLGTYQDQIYLPGVTDPTAFKDEESPPTPEHVFASREDTAWIQLATTREPDDSDRRKGRVMHFDNETRDLEGRYLPDQIVTRPTDDEMILWTDANAALDRPSALSMWIKPRAVADGKFLDVGGTSPDVDRISLLLDGGDLVLRVIDGFGDNNLTTEREAGELRFAVSGANTPGLPADIWSHVEIDVRGNRPSQMHMLVNGLAYGVRTPGMSRLSGGLTQGASQFALESGEGFPELCTLRIGNELVEARHTGGGNFDAARQETGTLAGFGGRIAREPMTTLSDTTPMVPVGLATIETSHPAGTPVELYGYALPTVSSVPTGRSQVAGDLGPFRVAIVRSVVGGSGGGALGEPITFGLGWTAGYGMKGVNSTVSGLVLASADDGLDTQNPTPASDYMSAFQRDGGYAIIVQVAPLYQNAPAEDNEGALIGGVEIIQYSGWQDTTLMIAKRGVDSSELPNLANIGQATHIGGAPRSFVVSWNPFIIEANTSIPWAQKISRQVFVLPISLGVPGSGDVSGFLAATVGNSQFAQITHVDDAELTEWVRYDWFETSRQQLVRDDPVALDYAYRVLAYNDRADLPTSDPNDPVDPPDPPPGGGGGGGGGGRAAMLAADPVALDALAETSSAEPLTTTAAEPLAASAQATYTGTWSPRIGENENKAADKPITRAVEIAFQFRGVSATYSHRHPNGTPILPVFAVRRTDFSGGRPGRMDAIFLAGSSPDHLGWPLRVHRSYTYPLQIERTGWTQPTGTVSNPTLRPEEAPATGGNGVPNPLPPDGNIASMCWVALQDRSPEPMVPGSAVPSATTTVADTRLITRMVCFPSGERPRVVTGMAIGGGVNGTPGTIPPAVVDEIVFGDAQFGRATPLVSGEDVAGASLVLQATADENAQSLLVEPKMIRISGGNFGADHTYLSDLPTDGGLLRAGDEIMAYQSLDPDSGQINIATNGRGLLGTRAQAHQIGEPVMFLEHRAVSVLSGPFSAGDSRMVLNSTEDFPSQGTVLIGQELITYTRLRDGSLEMPRASSVPGKMDQKGEGIFRGRFGTAVAAHAAGEAVILFPTRYPDRWEHRADAPELAYFGFSMDQPAAFWGSCFFAKEDTDSGRIGVLQRTRSTAPWDGDPEVDPHVKVFWQGETEAAAMPIGKQSDRIDWRVFVEYMPGAFDATSGAAHGWKQSPRLKLFSVFYHAPSMVLRSVER
jgi:hypothetical protein